MAQTGMVLWLMGPTSSGKTTIARRVEEELRDECSPVLHYDGDEVRDLFGENFGFEKGSRNLVVQALAHLADKAAAAGCNVVVSALTAMPEAREYIAENIRNMALVHIDCSITTCALRDPKGLYEKAKKGEIDTLIGWNTPYIAPNNPDITVNTEELSVEEAVSAILDFMKGRQR